MRLYVKYLMIVFKSQMQYRASFWLMTLGQLLVPFSIFAGVYLLFERFGQLKGWHFSKRRYALPSFIWRSASANVSPAGLTPSRA
ncbi:hypothetical protein PACILC2_53700 [Paenibacillus cisolokensis]|uniref:Uncharacterized protein n=1 Tax=Paenibacillus cisolokensis TaxID=1658519 RepID=A0ABQ4NF47_9BACL|nr:hypothetical protein PACILC2_53700 [Paenibacillus cisolokensis]